MEMAQAKLTLQQKWKVAEVDATRVRFSAHQCFSRDGGVDDRRCLGILADQLARQPGLAMCVDGDGAFLKYMLQHAPKLRQHIRCVIFENLADAKNGNIDGLPVVGVDQIPSEVKTVFLCETLTFPRMRMKKWLPEDLRRLEPDMLAEGDLTKLPARCWTPWSRDTIYPIDVPEIAFEPGMDMILIDCPARNLGLMPNGLGYVHNALKHVDVKYQTLDLDIILYHRFHIRRLFDDGGKVHLANGRELPTDPWQAEHYDLWGDQEVMSYFEPAMDEIVAKLTAAKPKILGVSLQGCNEKFTTKVVERVKQALPETIVVVGGFSCYSPDIGLRGFPLADYMCIGEADLTVGPLVERLAKGERPGNVPGVQSKFDAPGSPFVPAPMVHDLDKLDHPRYEWYPLDVYRNYNGYQLTPVIASRGCRWSRCTFCAERFYWRIRSPKAFVDELEWLVDRGCRLFMFNESDLNGKPEIVLEICEEIIRRGLKVKLTGQLRIHKKSDKHFFQKLRQAGFVALRFGVDAFSENTLRLQKKGYTTATVSQNLKDCWEAGIFTEVNWVIGVPGETDADCEEGIELILKNKPYIGRLANINPLILVTGGVYWLEPEEHNIVFRQPKEELYKKFPRALPANTWYSEKPYIDEKVRKQRFENIVLALHERNFDVGAWANRIIEDVTKNRDKNRAGPAEEAGPPPEEKTKLSAGVGGMKKPKPEDQANLEFNADARSAQYVFRAGSALPEDKVYYFRNYLYLAEWKGELHAIEPEDFEKAFGETYRQAQSANLGCMDVRRWFNAHFSRTKAAVPELLQSVGNYNIVYYDGLYYGLPQVPNWDMQALRNGGREQFRVRHTLWRFTKEWQNGTLAPWLKRNISRVATKVCSRGLGLVRKVLPKVAAPAGAAPPAPPARPPIDVRWGEDDVASFPDVVTSKNLAELVVRVEKITGTPSRVPKTLSRTEIAAYAASGAISLETVATPAAKSVPILVGSCEGYNIVEYEGWFYGVPQTMGDIHLDKVDVIENPNIIRDLSRDVVESEIREVLRQKMVAA